MSFNVNLQKTNKDSAEADRLIVRRFWYDKESKKNKSSVVYSVNKYKAPARIPDERITKFDVTDDEHQIYIKYVQALHSAQADAAAGICLAAIVREMDTLTQTLAKREDGLSLEQIQTLEQGYAQLKEQLNRHAYFRYAEKSATEQA